MHATFLLVWAGMPENSKNIRNFCIIAHIDHGKSTLADRLLEMTGTIEKRKMREQVLDSMELERERGITIKMTPVRMEYHTHSLTNADCTQTNAESRKEGEFLYGDLTYKIRGAAFKIKRELGLGHKEIVYQKALGEEFRKVGLSFEAEKSLDVFYAGTKVGLYRPDFIVENKIIVELKALSFISKQEEKQHWNYLKGSTYKVALLINFGGSDISFKRIVYDTARPESCQRQSASSLRRSAQGEHDFYVFNLIDTPGHIDFAYEVSRALKAVEGAVLLVDATQGVQAQTLTTLQMAREAGLTIVPVVNKIDSPLARVPETKKEISALLSCQESEILETSGKTGQGINELLEAIVSRVPPPATPQINADTEATQIVADGNQRISASYQRSSAFRALVFDFQYSTHTGVIVFLRIFDGEVRRGDELTLLAGKCAFKPIGVGVFTPERTPRDTLSEGEIGYLVTGIKEPGIARIGDTITSTRHSLPALPGYEKPRPVVWASVYPESQDDFAQLRQAFDRLRLSDSSFTYEEETSGLLGRGFRCGFLGMLHLEIITERLRREFNLSLVVTTPSITYEVVDKRGRRQTIYSAARFPEYNEIAEVYEPFVETRIITPPDYLPALMPMLYSHEAEVRVTENFGDNRNFLVLMMPLRELMRGFFDEIKSASSGFASLSYKITESRKADVVKLELLVAEEVVPAFSRIVSRKRVETEAETVVEKLQSILPRQLFVTKIQGKALGRIISSRTVRALAKDVTGYLYGGDRTRKMKLWQKQAEGKKRLKEQGRGRVRIPHEVFLKMVQSG